MSSKYTTTDASASSEELTWDDATWILLCSFAIFTMQTGFGLLEVGIVSPKNEANILMKNVVDIILGGFSYWIFGYSISYGTDPGSNPFNGVGMYAVNANLEEMGEVFTSFVFQLSFATTSTTIVSGAVAERCNFGAYCLFSLMNTVTYVFPAHWIWGPGGFLGEMGVIDIAGSGAVHLLGAASAFVASWMLGPRLGRYDNGIDPLPIGNPSSCLYGLLNLWWGWLAFNAGSTYGVTGKKWKFAARAAATTMIAAIGGGLVGIVYGFLKLRAILVLDIVNPVLGGLVGITASCAVVSTWEAFAIGVISGIIIILASSITDRLGIDDAVGATAVHGFGGIWGMLAVGFFTDDDGGAGFVKNSVGLFHGIDFHLPYGLKVVFLKGGSAYLLGVQALACLCIIVWSAATTFIIFSIIKLFVHIRMEDHEQLIGADFMEHHLRRRNVGVTPAISFYASLSDVRETIKKASYFGASNSRHDSILMALKEFRQGPIREDRKRQRGVKMQVLDFYRRWKKSAKGQRNGKLSDKLSQKTIKRNNNSITSLRSNSPDFNVPLPIYVQQNQNIWNTDKTHYPHVDYSKFYHKQPLNNIATMNYIQTNHGEVEKYPYQVYNGRNVYDNNNFRVMD